MDFYLLSSRPLWGDYGDILIGGMSCHLPRKDGLIQLERTGPFIPPVTLPGIGDVVVTTAVKDVLESSQFAGISFAPVLKAKIVEYRWEQWDLTRDEPPEYPEGGEPENYILARPHSKKTAEALGPLWEVVFPEDVEVEGVRRGRGLWEYRLKPSDWGGSHLFRPKGKRHIMASETGKTWLQQRAGEWLQFQKALVL